MNAPTITRHMIRYDFTGKLMLDETAYSLIALQRFSLRIPIILAKTSPAFADIKINPYLDAVEPGSELLKFYYELFFGTEEQRKKHVEALRSKLGLTEMQEKSPIMTALIQAGILAAVVGTMNYCSKAPTTTIDLSHNSGIIQMGAELMEVKPERYAKALRNTFKPSKALAADTLDLLAPSATRNAGITIDGAATQAITPEIIADLPREIPEQHTKEITKHHENVLADLRATDFDKNAAGWAVVINEVSARRLKMELAETINPASLRGKTLIHADVDVTYQLNAAGDYIPRHVYLKNFRR